MTSSSRVWVLLLAIGCTHRPVTRVEPSADSRAPQAISFTGDTLNAVPMSDSARARAERQLAAAKAAYDHTPANADSIVWLGRRLGYLGRFREAIDVYTRGIELYPRNAWLYRHRGHRYITVRELDRAIADLERAERLTRGQPDEVEPDGQPNAQNIPIGTLQSNIDYHLALAYYLKGDFARAIPVYRRELENARNDDRRVSIAYWYVLALKRLGRDAEAKAVLDGLPREMRIIENDTYRDLLRFFRGELRADSLLADAESHGVSSVPYVTTAYGVATWLKLAGREADARRIYEKIVAGSQWPAFGYIAAEAELARERKMARPRRG